MYEDYLFKNTFLTIAGDVCLWGFLKIFPGVSSVVKNGFGKLTSQVIFSYHKLNIIIAITLNHTWQCILFFYDNIPKLIWLMTNTFKIYHRGKYINKYCVDTFSNHEIQCSTQTRHLKYWK